MEQRTLGNVLGSQSTTRETENLDFNTYLTLFSINIVHRFPVNSIENIDVNSIENTARLCTVCTDIAVRTWNMYSQRGIQRRQERAA